MSKNRTSKYFKYAIGEIVLVVIGILIALQINNWNDSRKDRVQEQEYYCLLLEEVEQDKQQVLNLKTLTTQRYNAAIKAIEEIQKDRPKTAVFGKHWLTALRLAKSSFQANDGTYMDIKSSGNLNLIKDKSIIKALNKYLKNTKGYTETILGNIELEWWRVNNMENWFESGIFGSNNSDFYKDDIFTESIRQQLEKDVPMYISNSSKPELYSSAVITGQNNRRRLELLQLIENEVDKMQQVLEQKCNNND